MILAALLGVIAGLAAYGLFLFAIWKVVRIAIRPHTPLAQHPDRTPQHGADVGGVGASEIGHLDLEQY